MTTYRYSIDVNDSEMIALSAALEMYLRHCNEQLAEGPKAPYFAHRQSILDIQKHIRDKPTRTSWSSFT